jgi:hypothetical protein
MAVAVIVIVCAVVTDGEMNKPRFEMVPALVRQATSVFGELCTLAVSRRLAPLSITTPFGEISIEAESDACVDGAVLEVCRALWQAVIQRATVTESIRRTS